MSDLSTSTETIARRLRIPAYLILGFASAMPVVEALANLWPYAPGVPQWRFGALGTLSNMVSPAMIGLLLMTVVAATAGDRLMLWVLVLADCLLGAFALTAAGMFVLDALQTRAQIKPEVLHRFDFASGLALLRLLFIAVAGALLAYQSWRKLRSDKRTEAGVIVVGRKPSDVSKPALRAVVEG